MTTATEAIGETDLLKEIAALRPAEIEAKLERVAEFLDRQNLAAVLLSRHENIAWITGGQVEARVALGSETAVTSLVITSEGRRYYIAPNNEAPRLAEEEFLGLGYEPVIYPWHQGPGQSLHKLIGEATFGSDTPAVGAAHVNLTDLRTPLLPGEIVRLRALGREVANVTATILEQLQPGVTEYEMAALVSGGLLLHQIMPTVLLMAVDDRIRKYKHAVPRKGQLERYGMLNLCARRWGMVVSITRFVHFGPLPAELAASFTAAARINAELLHATRPGATSAELFDVAKRAYAAVGAAEEIELHHQGGPCGYTERDWVITPSGMERVVAPQAFAYNPSLRGAKVEDTVLIVDGPAAEVLTRTSSLPIIDTVIDGVTYRSAGVLER